MSNISKHVFYLFFFILAVVNSDAPGAETLVPQLRVVGDGATSEKPISIGKNVTVEFPNLDKWLAQEKAKQDLSDLVVYLDGIPFKSRLIRRDGPDQVKIRLQPTSDSKTAWSQLLGRPTEFTRSIKLSVGSIAGQQLPSQDLYVHVISTAWLSFYIVLLVVLLILFGQMAARSSIIRESTTLPAAVGLDTTITSTAVDYKPYSLAKLQMAVWFFLVLAAFLFIWIVTGQYDSITPQVLGLMGIATGTALGAAVIDDNKNRSAANELTDLRPRCDGLWAEINGLRPKVAELEKRVAATPVDLKDLDALKEAKTELAAKESLWEQLELKMKDAQSRMSELKTTNFLDDLLSDANGYSFHRFQIFAWTIVLGILFVRAVWAELAMPQFNETLLALMGVSGATYLGFKFPERPTDPSVPTIMGAGSGGQWPRGQGPGGPALGGQGPGGPEH